MRGRAASSSSGSSRSLIDAPRMVLPREATMRRKEVFIVGVNWDGIGRQKKGCQVRFRQAVVQVVRMGTGSRARFEPDKPSIYIGS
jgi:hypothetical protein